jgi:hypothetical protein
LAVLRRVGQRRVAINERNSAFPEPSCSETWKPHMTDATEDEAERLKRALAAERSVCAKSATRQMPSTEIQPAQTAD